MHKELKPTYCSSQEEQQKKAEKYDRMAAQIKLMCELNAGRRSGEEEGQIPAEDVRSHFNKKTNEK